MKPRFQADNDLRNAIRLGVLRREPSIDFTDARHLNLDGVGEPTVLDMCAREDRILVTHDETQCLLTFAISLPLEIEVRVYW